MAGCRKSGAEVGFVHFSQSDKRCTNETLQPALLRRTSSRWDKDILFEMYPRSWFTGDIRKARNGQEALQITCHTCVIYNPISYVSATEVTTAVSERSRRGPKFIRGYLFFDIQSSSRSLISSSGPMNTVTPVDSKRLLFFNNQRDR